MNLKWTWDGNARMDVCKFGNGHALPYPHFRHLKAIAILLNKLAQNAQRN